MRYYVRRGFLGDVGRGMLAAGVGPALAFDLGLAPAALADGDAERLTFGALEPLVSLMQETTPDRLLQAVVERLKAGTDLGRLVSAAALANARTFGGQDYVGYHALMALAPAYQMSRELPEAARALPVLKVIYRNTSHIQQLGGRSREVLRPVRPNPSPVATPGAALLEATRRGDMEGAEGAFVAIAQSPPVDAYNELLPVVHEYANVHRVVLAWRAWALLELTGAEHAHTLLRQSVRYCVSEERSARNDWRAAPLRTLLPELLDRHRKSGDIKTRSQPDDAGVERLAMTVYASSPATAAEAVAEALRDGTSFETVGEAISLAANQLVLHDPGRRQSNTPAKPKGSVHGDSVGVHASDAANAWRNIARVSNPRNSLASLIVGAYHTAGQAGGLETSAYPFEEHRGAVRGVAPDALLDATKAAIEAGDQAGACALVDRYGALSLPHRPVFDLLLGYAVSEDGALHAEKYYRTVSEEFAATRPAFRWRHLAALARVTASEYGRPAPGVAEARDLLKG